MDIETIKNIFEYKNGKLFYINKTHKFSKIKIGDEAGSLYSNGYLNVKLQNKRYGVHRLVFAMHNGYFPKMLDHIDGNKLNNNIENLRPATRSENSSNRGLMTNNTSGIKGVAWHKTSNKWEASCQVNKKRVKIGYFDELSEAEKAVKSFREQHHGVYARHQ